jgi:hypothetical protein
LLVGVIWEEQTEIHVELDLEFIESLKLIFEDPDLV